MLNKFKIIKKQNRKTNIAEKIFPIDKVTISANSDKKIFPIMLIKTDMLFLHKQVLVNPLSDDPKTANTTKETSAKTNANITENTIFASNP